jgi:hypothetical protein
MLYSQQNFIDSFVHDLVEQFVEKFHFRIA